MASKVHHDSAPRYGIGLIQLNASQIDAIRRIPPHGECLPPIINVTRPASIFTGQARYDLEQKRIFRRLPVPLLPTARMPAPGSVMAFEGYGLSLMSRAMPPGLPTCFITPARTKGPLWSITALRAGPRG